MSTLRILLILVFVLITWNDSFACGGFTPSAYFEAPSYLDPDYEDPSYGYDLYGPKTRFWKLLGLYAEYGIPLPNIDDQPMRDSAALVEPDRHTRYESGAWHFRNERYDSALVKFQALADESDSGKETGYSWVTEASTYMVARCQLIIAQTRYDGYGDPRNTVDQAMLARADSSYRNYCISYPNGLYHRSARDLRRKIYYLAGDQALLDRALKQLVLEAFPSGDSLARGASRDVRSILEFMNWFRGTIDLTSDSPILVAYVLSLSQPLDSTTLATLESRVADFAPYPNLYDYLHTLTLYRLGRYQQLLKENPETPVDTSLLWLSTQILRVRSLEKVGDSTGALTGLLAMYTVSPEPQLQVEIATRKINAGDAMWLFTQNGVITEPHALKAFALTALTDRQLQRGLRNAAVTGVKRQILLLELAKRYLLSHRFSELNALLDSAHVPFLDTMKSTVATLALDPNDVESLVSLGEFLFNSYCNPTTYLDEKSWGLWSLSPKDDLPACVPCQSFEARVAQYQPPMTLFLKAVSISRRTNTRSEFEAKALHYIVRGGRYGYWSGRCTWDREESRDEATKRSHNAFVRLHKLYKDSPWAEKTPYWYESW